jgi:hypothetical protein
MPLLTLLASIIFATNDIQINPSADLMAKWQPIINQIEQCESNGNENAIHEHDGDGTSFGILQFKYKTFRYYSEKFGVFNGKGFDEADWINAWHDRWSQELVASYMMENLTNWKSNWVVCTKNLN